MSNHNSKKPNPNYNRSDVSLQGTRVEVRNNDVTKAMRKFKRKVQDSGILDELRQKEFYEKPTTKRKRAKAAAKSRWKKQLEKQQLPSRLF